MNARALWPETMCKENTYEASTDEAGGVVDADDLHDRLPDGPVPARRAAAQTAGEVVGYYAAWAPWRGYGPEQLDPHQFTQINYAFADINQATGKVVLADPQREKETLAGLTALRKKNPNLKIVLSIGGWDYSTYFSDVASTAAGGRPLPRAAWS